MTAENTAIGSGYTAGDRIPTEIVLHSQSAASTTANPARLSDSDARRNEKHSFARSIPGFELHAKPFRESLGSTKWSFARNAKKVAWFNFVLRCVLEDVSTETLACTPILTARYIPHSIGSSHWRMAITGRELHFCVKDGNRKRLSA